MDSEKDLVKVSKTMSAILRHRALELGLNMDSAGWVPLAELLNVRGMRGVSASLVTYIVENNDKRRFSIETREGVKYIRANQGHSKEFVAVLDEEKLLTKITSPLPLCVHGTTEKALVEIMKSGLKPMGRTHIHLAQGFPKDGKVISGARRGCRVFVEVNMTECMADGFDFYLSDNGVVLCSSNIPPKYLKVHRV